jgi:hypothetical protein
MSAQQIVALASRLFAIWMLVYASRQLAVLSDVLFQGTKSLSAALYLIPLVTVILAGLIWLFPLAIARKLLPRTQHGNVIRMPPAAVAALAAATLGLWTLVQAIPDIVRVVHEMARGPRFTGQDFLYVLLPFLQLGIGLFLLNKPWIVADRIAPRAVAET